jgi:serine/threonine protein kinase
VVLAPFASPLRSHGLVHNRPNASVWDHYEEVKVIGHGMTGRVYMVQQKATKEKYALKVRLGRRNERQYFARATARRPRSAHLPRPQTPVRGG